MHLSDLDFDLPPELIAQDPPRERGASRLLHYRMADRSIAHRSFADLPEILKPGDLLVTNDARVVPAKFALHKPTGGRVDALFINELSPGTWNVLLRNLGPVRDHLVLTLDNGGGVTATIISKREAGEFMIRLSTDESAVRLLERVGRMPLPPYIKRGKDHDPRDTSDRERYQTVYAKSSGSVAAPTAGLHFTPSLFDQLESAGVQRTSVTLDVGLGTFKSVTAERLEDHAMHTERYRISEEAAAALNRAKSESRRMVAVGTTAARVLESQPAGRIHPQAGSTNIFIYPPYIPRHVDALVTNFHLPKSTLVALVAAFVGLDEQQRIYGEAIRERYRFFSFGDAMLIE